MQSQSDIAPTRLSRRVDALLLRVIALIALAAAALLYLPFAIPTEPVRPLDARCEPWDDAASVAFARLVAKRDETAEAFLGDAVFRLRPRAGTAAPDGLAWHASIMTRCRMRGSAIDIRLHRERRAEVSLSLPDDNGQFRSITTAPWLAYTKPLSG